jgi:pterin-4a-carbinolamine dehydratase
MRALLSSEEILRHLDSLAGWQLKGKTIERKLRFAGLRAAIGFVNRVD